MTKQKVTFSTDVFKLNDGNTTAIWVGVEIGSMKPVYIEALFRDNAEATKFQKELAAYEDIDEIADAIVRNYRAAGAEMIRVSTDNDAIVLGR